MPDRPAPISVLMSQALQAFTAAFDEAGREVVHPPSLPMWANVLRPIPDEGIVRRDLPTRAVVSERVARIALTKAERRGWVSVGTAKPKSAAPVSLTPSGRHARDRGWARIELVEAGWRERWPGPVTKLEASLRSILAGVDVELPHHVTGYGQGDASVTGGGWIPAQDGPPRIPAHGTEWPVVLRDPSLVGNLPLPALLSQGLAAFAIDYEAEGMWWLSSVANVLRLIGDEGTAQSAVAPEAEVTGSGRSTLERHRLVVVEDDSAGGKERVVRLTSRGRRLRDAYEPLLADIEDRWRDRFGRNAVQTLRSSLEVVVPALNADRLPHHPPVIAWLSHHER